MAFAFMERLFWSLRYPPWRVWLLHLQTGAQLPYTPPTVSDTGQSAEERQVVNQSRNRLAHPQLSVGLDWFCASQGLRDCEPELAFGGLCDLGKENF